MSDELQRQFKLIVNFSHFIYEKFFRRIFIKQRPYVSHKHRVITNIFFNKFFIFLARFLFSNHFINVKVEKLLIFFENFRKVLTYCLFIHQNMLIINIKPLKLNLADLKWNINILNHSWFDFLFVRIDWLMSHYSSFLNHKSLTNFFQIEP